MTIVPASALPLVRGLAKLAMRGGCACGRFVRQERPARGPDLQRTFLVLFLVRLALVVIALATLALRSTLPSWLLTRYAVVGCPLLLLNATALVARKPMAAWLWRQPAFLFVDLAMVLFVLQLGGGWRSSYFGYTLTTIVLFTIFDGRRGAAVSALALAAASLIKHPALESVSVEVFFSHSWDLRFGACEFYLVAGLTAGYFRTLQDRFVALSVAKLEETRKRAIAEEKARLGLELHDGAKQAVVAMLLRMSGLLKRVRPDSDEVAGELRWLWVGLNHLKGELDQVVAALKVGDVEASSNCDVRALLEDEVRIAETMTGFSWRLLIERQARTAEPGGETRMRVPTAEPGGEARATSPFAGALRGPQSALHRFMGEALTNAWKHSGEKHGCVSLDFRDGAVMITITDAGRGFVLADGLAGNSSGLKSLQRRAAELKASVSIDTAPGRGCRVNLTLPLKEQVVESD